MYDLVLTYSTFAEAAYFGTGKVDRDQVLDYMALKGWTLDEAEKWLAPILGYDP